MEFYPDVLQLENRSPSKFYGGLTNSVSEEQNPTAAGESTTIHHIFFPSTANCQK